MGGVCRLAGHDDNYRVLRQPAPFHHQPTTHAHTAHALTAHASVPRAHQAGAATGKHAPTCHHCHHAFALTPSHRRTVGLVRRRRVLSFAMFLRVGAVPPCSALLGWPRGNVPTPTPRRCRPRQARRTPRRCGVHGCHCGGQRRGQGPSGAQEEAGQATEGASVGQGCASPRCSAAAAIRCGRHRCWCGHAHVRQRSAQQCELQRWAGRGWSARAAVLASPCRCQRWCPAASVARCAEADAVLESQ